MSENQLAVPNSLLSLVQASKVKYADEKAELAVTSSGQQFPYIIVCGATTKVAQAGKINVGHFAMFQGKNFTDLGKSFIGLFLKWRPKAMAYEGNARSSYDPNSAEFKDIEEAANAGTQGYSYGPEFLVWLPEFGKFATYLLGNKTGRNESPNILGPLKEQGIFVCKQTAELIEGKKHSWHGPRTYAYEHQIQMPEEESLRLALEKFANPPVSQIEKDTDGDDRD